MNRMHLMRLLPRTVSHRLNSVYNILYRPPFRRYLPIKELTIETTSYCNLRCKGCYRTNHNYKSKNRHMALRDFKDFINQLPLVYSLILHGQGEPTLNLHLPEMIKYARDSKKINAISFTTNILAADPHIYDILFANGLNFIVISVDSLDQNEADILRAGTSVSRLVKNISYLTSKFADRILFRMAISKINFKTADSTVKQLIKLGAKRIGFQPYFDLGDSTICLSAEERCFFLQKVKKLEIEEVKLSFSPMFGLTKNPCNNIYFSPVITVDGQLSPCCAVYDKEVFTLGNLKEVPFRKLFFSRKNDVLQKAIWKGNYPPFCKGCASNHTIQVLWGK